MAFHRMVKWLKLVMALKDGLAAYQLVGEVKLTKAKTGSWSERMISHNGTETRPGHLRVAAV